MSGAFSDPARNAVLPSPGSEPGGGDFARLRLDRAIRLARYAIAWERLWPHLVRFLMVAGVFLAASWLGVWLALPLFGRLILLAFFLLSAIGTLVPMVRLRWPSRDEALRRLDRDAGLAHRPATQLTDHLTSNDPVAQALWRIQRERVLRSLSRLRPRLPEPQMVRHDPIALRALVILLVCATFIAAGSERRARLAAAFEWDRVAPGQSVRVDAWVSPPPYTGKPPMILQAGARDPGAHDDTVLTVPAGSTLIVRVSGAALDLAVTGAIHETAAADAAPAPEQAAKPSAEREGAQEQRFTIAGDGTAQLRAPSSQPLWRFVALPDHAPTIAYAKDPERMARGALRLTYKIEDDYGVTGAEARFVLRDDPPKMPDPPAAADADAAPRPLFEPPSIPLSLPSGRTRQGTGQTTKDLTESPYAGAIGELTLIARDEGGNEGRSAPLALRLPERIFTKPLARALIEQRRILALDAKKAQAVMTAFSALSLAPELFSTSAGEYLGLRNVAHELTHARTDNALREVVASIWALAVTIEDGTLTDVEKALRAAQDALKQALERGASDEEIKKLTDQLRAALDNYMRQLAEQMRNNPQQMARPFDPNARIMRQQDLDNMISRMEQLSRSGNKEAAQQLLDQLQQMLENLQTAQPMQGDPAGDMEQALNELSDMIRKQQQLRDRTFREGQQQGERNRQQQGQPNAMDGLRQDQQGLRDRLRKLQEELTKRGLGQQRDARKGQQGKQGQQGEADQGQGGDTEGALDDADTAMGNAEGELGRQNPGAATGAQGDALEAMRRGAKGLADAMQQQQGDNGEGDGPGDRPGRRQYGGEQTDPLGRPLRGRDLNDDQSVKIPGEIDVQRVRRILEELRRRLADPTRPQIELDYLERLLKDY